MVRTKSSSTVMCLYCATICRMHDYGTAATLVQSLYFARHSAMTGGMFLRAASSGVTV
jgi:hypothetical protein